jgi:predicted amidohydrolase
MWENCYYLAGTDDGILGTPAGKIGAALCWEFIRSRTAARMAGKVDMVVGGSCWWTLPERRLPGFPARLKEQNLAIMKDTPRRLARMLGVPVVHAAHAGEFRGRMPLLPGFPFKSYLLGETQIVAPDGEVLVRMAREEGAGFVMADIEPGAKAAPREPVPDRFWIPDLPWQLRFVWWYQNLHGRWYYRWRTRPYRRREAASSL